MPTSVHAARHAAPAALRPPRPTALASAALLACLLQAAQAQQVAEDATVQAVGVSAPAIKRSAKASIVGLGDLPAWETPAQAQTFSSDVLRDAFVTRLADLTRLDASTTDSYNTVGYWDYLTVRGFTLDNAYNYRREGLPVNAETRLPLENKSAVELFKGTSGIQAGVSAPGGLVNLLVKRPEGRVHSAFFSVNDAGEARAAVDVGGRFGPERSLGLRVNAAVARLNTQIDNTEGHSRLLSVATDWRLSRNTLIELELEDSWQSQPSVAGLSLLGDRLPSSRTFSRKLNLNNQPWSQPVQFEGRTGTLRWTQNFQAGWRSTVTYGEQHLRSNDRAAFPFGWNEYVGPGADDYAYYYNFKSDGSVDLYDYRSDNERRITRSLLAQLDGRMQLAGLEHNVRFGLLRSLYRTSLKPQAYNDVGTLNVLTGPYAPTVAAPEMDDASPNRWENSTELSVQDHVRLAPNWQAWVGVRHTSLSRHRQETDGAKDTYIDQTLNTPWAALGWTLAPQTQAYVSWGEGVETKAAPRNAALANAGQILPAAKSRQTEVGVKGQYSAGRVSAQWGANLFQTLRPLAETIDSTFRYNGDARHRGLEGFWQGRVGPWGLAASAMVLDAERRGSTDGTVNGKQPVNVPERTVKVSGSHTWGLPVPLTVQADVVHEGSRWVDTANTVRLPAWTRLDLGVRAVQGREALRTVTWRLNVANVFDKRGWREAPSMFGGHTYLFPILGRTVTASAQIDF
ncbi:MAG: TonB-dependent siderophore receptor [Aquabacterium sp.]